MDSYARNSSASIVHMSPSSRPLFFLTNDFCLKMGFWLLKCVSNPWWLISLLKVEILELSELTAVEAIMSL